MIAKKACQFSRGEWHAFYLCELQSVKLYQFRSCLVQVKETAND